VARTDGHRPPHAVETIDNEIRNLISSGAMVTGTLSGGNNAHNSRVVDVKLLGNTGQTFAVDVQSPDDLADLAGC
jgi:hypothetical protein